MLKLAFAGPIAFDRETGLLNTNFSMPFKALGGDCMCGNRMVPPEGETLNSLFDELARWNKLLEAENIDWEALEP